MRQVSSDAAQGSSSTLFSTFNSPIRCWTRGHLLARAPSASSLTPNCDFAIFPIPRRNHGRNLALFSFIHPLSRCRLHTVSISLRCSWPHSAAQSADTAYLQLRRQRKPQHPNFATTTQHRNIATSQRRNDATTNATPQQQRLMLVQKSLVRCHIPLLIEISCVTVCDYHQTGAANVFPPSALPCPPCRTSQPHHPRQATPISPQSPKGGCHRQSETNARHPFGRLDVLDVRLDVWTLAVRTARKATP